MQGVGPGSLLGGRYVVQRRVAQHVRFERWTAADQTLDREVVLLCFDAAGPQTSATLDAARRAAGIEEARLVRILDVGSHEGVAFVVEEPLTGARSLTSVLGEGGLPAEEARRVVGEAASALEAARVRGLHHQVLTPRSVMVLEDGAIKVRGLATEAALLEADEGGSESASRTDAVSLVALAYAVLTGRWPLVGPDSGLEAAPRVVGGVAAPSEISAGVPQDLDLISRQTLNEDKGPLSPGDLAGQIAPWSPSAIGSSGPRQRRAGDRTEPLRRDPATGGVAASEGAALGVAASPAAASPPAARPGPRTVLGMGLGAGRGPAGVDDDSLEPGSDRSGQIPTGREVRGPEAREERGSAPRRSGAVAGAVATGASAVASGAAAGSAVVAKGVGAALGAAGAAAASVGSSVGGFARSAADRAAEKSSSRADRRQTENLTDDLFDGRDMRLSDTLEDSDEPLRHAVPMLTGGNAEPLDRHQSKIALLVVGGLVLVAALLGFWGLPKFGSGAASSSVTAPVVTATVTATPTAAAPTQPPATSPPAALQPLAVVGVQAWDPEGDLQEGNASAPRAIDGDGATKWRSQAYTSAPFGGFPKSGIGLVLDLGQQSDVHQVDVDLVGGSDLTVYVASRLSLSGATSIGSVSGQDGTVTIKAPGGSAKGQLVILWFTRLAADGEGAFRAQVAEARVS